MLDFISPREFQGELYQPKSLVKPPYLNLEEIITQLIRNRKEDYQESDLKGRLGEIVSRELIRYNLSRNSKFDSNKLFDFKGKEYVLGESKRGEIIKFDSQGRVVLIKKQNPLHDDIKFGFKNISEIDGILRLRRRFSRRRRIDNYVVVESKTGKIDVNSTHIRDRILKPYSRILDSPISYILVGFKDYLMDKERVLNPKVGEMYEVVNAENLRRSKKKSLQAFSFTAISFPFSQDYFSEIIKYGLELQKGILSIKGEYFPDNNLAEISTSRGEHMSGLYVPDNHPKYEEIQRLLNSS